MFEPSKESNLDSPVSKFLPVFLRFTVGYNYSSFRDFFLVLIKNHFFDAVKEKMSELEEKVNAQSNADDVVNKVAKF